MKTFPPKPLYFYFRAYEIHYTTLHCTALHYTAHILIHVLFVERDRLGFLFVFFVFDTADDDDDDQHHHHHHDP